MYKSWKTKTPRKLNRRQKGKKYERNRKNQRFNGKDLAHDIEAFQKKRTEGTKI